MIIAAAIEFGDLVLHLPAPHRHHHIMRLLHYYFDGRAHTSYADEVQGFLTDKGEFLNRIDAMQHALAAGQTLTRRAGGYDGLELYSEDLW
jgi:hypothetical protein